MDLSVFAKMGSQRVAIRQHVAATTWDVAAASLVVTRLFTGPGRLSLDWVRTRRA